MHHILFEIPIPFTSTRIPLFGFGVMMLVAFLVSAWVATRRARQDGIHAEVVWDFALWVFVGGLLSARITSMILEPINGDLGQQFFQFFKIWEGGLVLYGAIPGALIAYYFVYRTIIKPRGIRAMQLLDILAPSIALGIFFGRIGCFLNGCCWGIPADPVHTPAWLAVQFPGNSPPHRDMVHRGHQTGFGFVLGDQDLPPQWRAPDPRTVFLVEPGSGAAAARLTPGDVIVAVGEAATDTREDVYAHLQRWPQRTPLTISIERKSDPAPRRTLTFDLPRSIPLHPAQLYGALDGLLTFVLLWAFYPYRRRDGAVVAMLMIVNGLTRIFIEKLRSDNPPDYFGLTISQLVGAVLVFVGLVLMLYLQARPPTPQKVAGGTS